MAIDLLPKSLGYLISDRQRSTRSVDTRHTIGFFFSWNFVFVWLFADRLTD